jgi:DNA-binding PadR family transcriptional regulator
MQALSDRTGGTYTPSAGTIYPRLAKLEEEGLVTKTVDGRKTVYAITEAGRAEVAARPGDLEGIEAGLADSVRLIADEVRGSVREAMKSLRADLAAAARADGDAAQHRAAASATPRTARADPASSCGGPRRSSPSSARTCGPICARTSRTGRARGIRRRRPVPRARRGGARPHPPLRG